MVRARRREVFFVIDYTKMMNAVLDHIELHLAGRLSVEDLAMRSGYSPFHFARMFRACVGMSVKQYVLGRKLEAARQCLVVGRGRVIDVALEFGFESPEVFSRAFRRTYGLAPSQANKLSQLAQRTRPHRAVERNIGNWRGMLLPDGRIETLGGVDLVGVHGEVDVSAPSWAADLRQQAGDFLTLDPAAVGLDPARLFLVVRCLGAADGNHFDVFHGREVTNREQKPDFAAFPIPPGSWASFSYRGDLVAIRDTIEDDLYRWMAVRGLSPPAETNVGMLMELAADYERTQRVRLRIPLAHPAPSV